MKLTGEGEIKMDEPTKAPEDEPSSNSAGTKNIRPKKDDGSEDVNEKVDPFGALPENNVVIALIQRYDSAMRDGNMRVAAKIADEIDEIRKSRQLNPNEIEALKRFDTTRRASHERS
jgi:hypothetical protein